MSLFLEIVFLADRTKGHKISKSLYIYIYIIYTNNNSKLAENYPTVVNAHNALLTSY